jgi:signal transduction histidine kinase
MRRTFSTTLRIALISGLLALIANAALIGYVRYTTQTSALAEMRAGVEEEGQALRAQFSSMPPPTRNAALAQTISDADPDFLAGLYGRDGTRLSGNLVERPARPFLTGHSYEVLAFADGEAGLIAEPLKGGGWLVSGRRFGEALSQAHALERTLTLASLFAVALGLLTGLAVAAYVHRRVRGMVRTIDGIGGGDFAMRLASGHSRDGFDLLADRINAMLDRIDGLMAELRVLTDSLAHDLRSPIGRLRTKVERALGLADERLRDDLLASALADADALTRQLTTVLEIGRAEAMTGTARFEPVDPLALARELADLYEPVADDKGMEIRTDLVPGAITLHAHRQLLTQALGNLVDNAIRHAGVGPLTIFARVADGHVSLGVADCGPGIASEQMAEARRRYGRLDAARSVEGAGLGLSLAEAVARLHHGALMLEDNQPGLHAALVLPLDVPAGQSSVRAPDTQL